MTGRADSEADSEVGHTTPEHRDLTNTALDEPTASRATLGRRLRAVERALCGVDEIEEVAPADGAASATEDLDAVAERLDALERAIRAIGEYLADRDRSRRATDDFASVMQSVEALPVSDTEVGTSDVPDGGSGSRGDGPEVASPREEASTEWLARVAAGGVTPPPIE